MRIVIDCFKLIKGKGKSVGIYNVAISLVQCLLKRREVTEDSRIRTSEIYVLGNSENERDFRINGVQFIPITNYRPTNKAHCILWELYGVTAVCKKLRADRVVFPRGYCGLFHPVKDIVLIHDVIPFYYDKYFPGEFGKAENAYIMHRLKKSAQSCNRIITISEASKRDIVQYCKVDEKKISVIYNSCGDISYPSAGERLGEAPYICAITSGFPHKNAKGILESYEKYCKIAEHPLDLAVIGIADTASFYRLPKDVEERVTCYKFIKDRNELYRIIAGSKLFLFLSLKEGFGLPPVEAMQLKVPVVCSNVSSLPEVAGDAAVLVDPNNPDEVAKSIDELLRNEKRQKELIEKGLKNIERFSGETRGEQYWDVLVKE